MRKEEIIAKGAYTAPQFGELISVRQFIMLREKGEKHLLLRLRNDRAERADAVSFRVKQFDIKGNLIGAETVTERNIAAESGQEFAPDTPVKLNHACVDFTVEMVSAVYGDYTYHLHGDTLTSSYESRSEEPPLDKEAIAKSLRGRSGRVTVKTGHAPRLLVASMAIILLVVAVFAFLQLKNFMATEEFFTLESVDYRFLTDDHENGPISIIGYRGDAGNIIIPADVEGHEVAEIADRAFEGKVLRSVIIKGSPAIGERAFADCKYLDKVEIPHVTEIGYAAFAGCGELEELTLSSSLTAIPATAFEACRSLTEIHLPVGLVSLDSGAFRGCSSLTTVTLPATLTHMGTEVFADCESLTSLTAPYAGMNEVGQDTIGYFFGGSDRIPHTLTSITVTKATAIGSYAFGGCSSVEEVSLPDSVKSIGYGAFDGCTKLTSLRLPAGLTQLGCDAFRNCISLRSVAIPAGVRTLPVGTFADCTGLQTVTLPDGLEQIETDAFANCTSLTLLDIPESVNLLQSNALGGCTGLETLTIPFLGESAEAPMPLSMLFGAPLHGLKTLTVRNTTEIVDMAFGGFDSLQSVTLQGTATKVGSRAFEKCTSLQSVTLPDTVTDMGEYAFAECISLPAVVLPAELTAISEGVFVGCSSLKRIDAPAGLRTLGNRAFAGCSSLEDVSWLRDVTDMGEYVFDSCTSLKEATLPTAMTAIKDGTFNACSGLQTVTLSPVTEVIGRRAFGGCSALSNVSIPEQTREILAEAFADCSSLTAVSLPSTLRFLGQSAYAGCSSMIDLTVPAGIVEMGESILAGCTSLKTLSVPYIGRSRDNAAELAYLMGSDIPESLRSVQVTHALTLANDTFNNCSGIESIQLASGLTAIGENAFRNCAALDSLIIPETVTEIGAYAFSGCRGLKEILIPKTVTLLQKGILAGCDSLTKVTVPFIGESRSTPSPLTHLFYGASIPSPLTAVTLTDADALDDYTFENCSRLRTITLNKDLKTIGAYAFYNCRGLQTLTIPSTVTRIENNAFDGCTALKKITIPSSVTSIGANALLNCRSLTEVNIPFVGTSRYDSSAFAALFGGHKDIPVSLTKVTVTDSTTVKDNAFSGMSNLEEIVYTHPVTAIGVSAFNGCSSLTSFAFSDGLVSIGERAFYNCDGLTELVLPEGIDSIGERAFYNCDGLTSATVGSTATSIGQYAFGQCNNLTELTIPFVGGTPDDGNGLSYVFGNRWDMPQGLRKVTVTNSTTVKDNAFSGMSNLEEVVYEQPITAIGAGSFYNCSSLAAFDIPDTVIFVGNEAFYNCDSLTGVHLSGGDVTLGSNAFYDCDGIIELNATDGTVNIGSQAFANCDNLTTLNVSDGSVTIGYESFYNCDGLTELVLPEGINSIGDRAFYDCSNLTSATVGSTATSIGQYAFGQCNNLTELTIPFVGGDPYDGNNLSYWFGNQWNIPQGLRKITVTNSSTVKDNAFSGMSNLQEVVYEQPITAVGVSAFNGCSSLTSFAFSDGLVSIGERAFYNCDGLTELVLPEGIDSIGERAFYNCDGLTSATVGSTATSIGQYAFGQCNNLTELTIPFVGGTPDDGNGLSYVFGDQWNMPQGLRRVTVTNSSTVKDNAFNGMSNLEEIVYEQAITAIGASAFYNCSSLAAFDIPDSIVSIGYGAFRNCDGLTELHIPDGIESIGERAFYDCSNLTSATVGDTATSIGYNAFRYCYNLTELTVPFVGGTPDDGNGLSYWFGNQWDMPQSLRKVTVTNSTTVKDNAFSGMSNLEEIVYEQTITAIGASAFNNCMSLTTFDIPDTVTSIGSRAFYGCSSLNEIHVPEGVESFGEYAFYNCNGISELTFAAESVDIGSHAFANCDNLTTLNVSDGSVTIGYEAFYSCDGLTELTLPDGIESIGERAFYNCNGLTSMTVNDTVSSIGYNAFGQCNNLTELTVPFVGGTPDDGNGLSYWFGNQWDMPQSLRKVTVTNSTTVKDNAFNGMNNLEEVVYEQTITDIGSSAFYNCTSLATFDIPDTVTSIGYEAFYNCDGLTELTLPDGIESIGERAFYNCNGLTSMTVNDTVSSIGYNAFGQCNNLTELTVPFVGGTPDDGNNLSYVFGDQWNMPQSLRKVTVTDSTTVKPYAFQSLQYVEEIVYTQDVTEIGNNAFESCTALKRVELGDAIETIGSYSFSNCYALKSFTIPAGCQSVGNYAFMSCYALYEVYNDSELTFAEWDMTYLRNNCLAYRTDDTPVEKVSVDGVELLLADNGTWYVVDYTGDSESLTLPASFTANGVSVDSYGIAPYAFRNRKDIYSVTVPAAVTFISHQAFEGCTNLREVYNLSSLSITKGSYDHGQVAYYAYIVHASTDAEPLSNVRIGDFEFYKSDDSWFLAHYHGAGGDVILDSFTYEGEEIPSYEVLRSAFQGNGSITSLVITDAVKSMDPYAFQSMGSLQSVRFEDNTEMTVIPEYAFAWCYNLKQVTLPSTLTEIRYDAFWECQALREIYNLSSLELTMGASDHGRVAQYAFIIHDSLDDPALSEVRIGDYVFLNSGDIWLLERYEGTESDIVLGAFTHDGVTVNSYAIMTGAFRYNSYVERVVIGDEVKSIGREAFYNCNRLKSVSFADNTSITTILPYTFAYSRNLDTVILPAGLTSIEYDAFWDCTNLWVVCNLSDLDLTIGSGNDGYVAYYAKVILTSPDEDELRVMNVDQRGYTYKFYCEDGEWSLYARVQYSGYDWQYILPELVIDGIVTPYRVATGISGYSQIVIPASVTYVDLNSFTGSEILYGGTAEEFAALTEGYDVSYYTVRYYANCVHNEEQWSYYPDGSIMVGMSYSSTVIKDATCTEKGIIQYTCSHCQETWEGETQSFGNHDMDEDHRCRICGARFESRPLQDVWKVTNDALYPFDITENGEIVSTNKGDSQVATITLEALYATVFTYDYYVSTEGNCDVLIVRKNGVDLTHASGTGADVQRGVTVDVAAGDVITVTYSKDGSVSTGEDLVKILNLVYFVEEAGDTVER